MMTTARRMLSLGSHAIPNAALPGRAKSPPMWEVERHEVSGKGGGTNSLLGGSMDYGHSFTS
jgi:hypothetical protein